MCTENASLSLIGFGTWILKHYPSKKRNLMILVDDYDRALSALITNCLAGERGFTIELGAC